MLVHEMRATHLTSAGLHTLPELLLIIQGIQDLELHGENVDVSWQYHDCINAVLFKGVEVRINNQYV